jgi:cellulose synthase/poly-beta-1,6-N-acetylglucosamine synthase-like glycosyltransferase
MKYLAFLSLGIWVGLVAFHDAFWRADERDDDDDEPVPDPSRWPTVTAVVPARNEAEVIARAIGSLAAQDYPGELRVVLVDDGSTDDTAEIARRAGGDRLTVIGGTEPPAGWTGKLWAVRRGIEHAGPEPKYLWLTDADIEHAPDTLSSRGASATASR